jgi:hypothetical protein
MDGPSTLAPTRSTAYRSGNAFQAAEIFDGRLLREMSKHSGHRRSTTSMRRTMAKTTKAPQGSHD